MTELNTTNLERIAKAIKKLNVDYQAIDIKGLWNKDESYQQNKSRILEQAKQLSPDTKKRLEEKHQKDEQEALERLMKKKEEEHFKEVFNKRIDELKKSEIKVLSNYFTNYFSHIDAVLENKKLNGMLVVGDAGIGKTFNLMSRLKEKELSFETCKGHISPLSFYKFLYENRENKIIVIDDVVVLMKNDDILSLLLGALDCNNRLVKWTSNSPLLADLPENFLFNSKIFILANEIDIDNKFIRALKDRCIYFELNFTKEEILEMLYILAKANNYSLELVDYIKEVGENFVIKNLSLRLLHKVYTYYGKGGWKKLVSSILEIDDDSSVILQLTKDYPTVKEQIEKWRTITGLSESTFYRRKRELFREVSG